ncbi:hypothetical protein MIMGU_mgv1a017422mg [Erythranthe guttata]|uniref:Peptidase A1 domain-containing protein n=1 Tax=Erythranthe guttata TaxID=4155 RepID=A0A022R9R2_ERYGU|nr:hypothetical protein MIMGU_mgv1a017422mg [Erythranthe guttata]
MEGYRIVFDREEMVLGWKESNCYDSILSKTLPPNKGNSSRPSPPPPPPTNGVGRLTSGLVTVLVATSSHHFAILSS